jgi:hypothetical protein
MITTTFTALRKAHACTEGYRKLAKHLGSVRKYGVNTPIPVSVVLESNGLDDALWVLRNAALEDVKPLMVTWACNCAERVLPLWEAKYPNDQPPHDAIAAIRAASYVADASYVVDAASYVASWAASHAARAADSACAASWAADSTCAAAYAAARASYAAARASADVAHTAERRWQANRLKELLG